MIILLFFILFIVFIALPYITGYLKTLNVNANNTNSTNSDDTIADDATVVPWYTIQQNTPLSDIIFTNTTANNESSDNNSTYTDAEADADNCVNADL